MPAVEVKIPTLGESISEGVVARWLKADGAAAKLDEPLLELETDKATVEIPSPKAGIVKPLRKLGETVRVGDVVALIEEGAASSNGKSAAKGTTASEPAALAAAPASAKKPEAKSARLAPSVRKLVAEHNLDPGEIAATGRDGRITQNDVIAHLESKTSAAQTDSSSVDAAAASGTPAAPAPSASVSAPQTEGIRREPMSRLRLRIAERLVQAQHTAAILTTFNEIDMSAVMDWRARHKERFQKKHGVPLGFVSFFAKAVCGALADVPIVGARIDGTDLVYSDRVHLGVAVATERGLVVPVIRNAETLGLAGIERELGRLATLAREGKLMPDQLAGGTFTLSNGGVFGSLLSTPILNPPQSGILGMHKIEKRPVVVDDQIVIRPMMYVALSYDHRVVDGEQAVTFLVRVKERLEDPARLVLDV
jgi:2-oxoglutarate dehydrogenase E2 component (dihydrolipoamide succinyltransferase)